MKTSVLSKEFYKFNTTATGSVCVCVCVKFNKPVLKPIWENNCVGIVKKYLKKKYNEGGLAPSDNKTLPNCANWSGGELAWDKTYASMSQDREFKRALIKGSSVQDKVSFKSSRERLNLSINIVEIIGYSCEKHTHT